MTTSYITLDKLVSRITPLESMPVPIQEALKNSVNLTLITNLVAIPALFIAQAIMRSSWPVEGGFFVFTAGAVNWLIEIAYPLSGLLLVLNFLSLAMVLFVFIASKGMEKPVKEEVHWLAAVAAFPSGASAISGVIAIALFLLIVAVSIVIWIFIIMLFIGVLGSMLAR